MLFELSENEKKFLLRLARQVIADYLEGLDSPGKTYYTDLLKKKTGAFVTLNNSGDLRGCIGYIDPILPLQDTIAELALSAAFNDPRFPPLGPDELGDMEIEISVLTPKQKINDISQIEIGRDGLIIKQGYHEGLLLPQVATDYNWDVLTFLEQTCRKAGLSTSAWKEKSTQILRFSALIFSESEFNLN